MDDLLYIVLVVLWVAFGLYQNARKQQKKKTTHSPQPSSGHSPQTQQPKPDYIPRPVPQPDFEDVLGELLGLPKEEPRSQPVYEPVRQAEPQSPLQYKNLVDQIKRPKYESIEFDNRQAGNYKIQNHADDEMNELVFQDFDLRQAVVYAAILQRPYQA